MKRIILLAVAIATALTLFAGVTSAQGNSEEKAAPQREGAKPVKYVEGMRDVKFTNPNERGRIYDRVTAKQAEKLEAAGVIEINEPAQDAFPMQDEDPFAPDDGDADLPAEPADVVTGGDEFYFANGEQSELQVVEADEAWAKKGGSGGKGGSVAILDSGVRNSHQEFQGGSSTKIPYEYDFFENDAVAQPASDHGTMVASTVGARDNSYGMLGVAPNTQLLDAKVCGPNPTEVSCPFSDIAEATRWSVDKGAKVLNMSLGALYPSQPTSPASQSLRDAITYANSKNALVVASGGNDGANTSLVFPACFGEAEGDDDFVLGVGATTPDGQQPASFSNRGPCNEVNAPGQDIVAALASADTHFTLGFNGTSASAPIVSGGAKDVRSNRVAARKSASRMVVFDRVVKNARHVPTLAPLGTDRLLSVICSISPTSTDCQNPY